MKRKLEEEEELLQDHAEALLMDLLGNEDQDKDELDVMLASLLAENWMTLMKRLNQHGVALVTESTEQEKGFQGCV